MTAVRVLIADDHMVVRMGLAAIVRHEPDLEIVGEAANGRELLELARLHRPDVILMDLRMPGLSGAEVIARLCEEDAATRVIVLTIHKGDEAAYQALQAGARGYLLKDTPASEIVAAIREVAAGGSRLAPEVATQVAQRLGRAALTAREREVLRLMGEGFSNKELAYELGMAETTTEKHVSSVLQKLGARDRIQAVRLALERGLLDLEG